MFLQRTWIRPTICFVLSVGLMASAVAYYQSTVQRPSRESAEQPNAEMKSTLSIETSIEPDPPD